MIELKNNFSKQLIALKQKAISFHDKKTSNEKFINYDYMEYISLKYTSKSFKEICESEDVDSLNTIINNF